MRQIKFRGISLTNHKWVYGDSIKHTDNDDGSKQGYSELTYIGNKISNSRKVGAMKWVPIDPETIGQFTGLHDKNGKEIYEGDIIEEQDIRYEVCWYEAIAAFMAEEIEEEKPFLMSDIDLSVTSVIGNIHDNPKILKGDK